MGWRRPAELVATGFDRSRIVIVNEAHNGWARCVRTRRVGLEAVDAAHEAGCRHLAMEALPNPTAGSSTTSEMPPPLIYLEHPELRDLVAHALALGWTLVGYEQGAGQEPEPTVDPASTNAANVRERAQASNLTEAISRLGTAPLLVWCGPGHLHKTPIGAWTPMASLLTASGTELFGDGVSWGRRRWRGSPPCRRVRPAPRCRSPSRQHGAARSWPSASPS